MNYNHASRLDRQHKRLHVPLAVVCHNIIHSYMVSENFSNIQNRSATNRPILCTVPNNVLLQFKIRYNFNLKKSKFQHSFLLEYHFLKTDTSSDYKESSTLMERNVWFPRSQKLSVGGPISHTHHSLQGLYQYRRCGILVYIPKQIAIHRHLPSVSRNGGNLPTRLP